MMFRKDCGDWEIRIGRFGLYRSFFPFDLISQWWRPKFGWWEDSARSRNYSWFGWQFRIYRKKDVVSLLNRRFNKMIGIL
jgi:hypothetical protein